MNKKKKWLSLLLSLALLFSLCPQTVSAEEISSGQTEETCPFVVTGGTEGTDYEWSENESKLTIKTDKPLTLSTPNNSAENPATAHIHAPSVNNQSTNAKLTLNGVHITEPQNTAYGAICVTGTLEITLAEGSTNTLTGGTVSSNYSVSYGIFASGALTISGAGTLNATGGAVTTSSSSTNNLSCGIQCNSTISISEGTIHATGGSVSNGSSYGIRAYGEDYKAINITGGTVTATGGNVSASGNATSAGICGAPTISGGVVNATGGTVTVSGSEAIARSYGIRADTGSLTISGGSGTAKTTATNATIKQAMDKEPTLSNVYISGTETDTFRKWLPKAAEQYSVLTPGETYWFDLSGQKESIGGTVNTELPDTGMHWVPFTYVGTVNAYKLESEQATTEEYASTNQSAHSLFIANYDLTQASWNDLNGKNLIFDTSYTNNGVNYTLRAPSAGSKTVKIDDSTEYVTPLTNEWDSILMKDDADTTQPEAYIKNATSTNQYSWGQDTSAIENDSVKRIVRKGGEYTSNTLPADGTEQSGSNGWYRPVLELTSGADLKVVEVNLNGGLLGTTDGNIKIVTTSANMSSLNLPIEGITAPTSNLFTGWNFNETEARYTAGWGAPVTLTYDANGATSGTAPAANNYGNGATVTVLGAGSLAKDGYTFAGWNTAADGTGTGYAAGDTFTITGDTTLYAQWTESSGGGTTETYYTITATAGANGSITPGGSVSVKENTDKTFTITAASGYEVADVKVDGKSVGAVKSYTFTKVTGNHTIAATFKTTGGSSTGGSGTGGGSTGGGAADTYYTITATAGTGGSISPTGSISVREDLDKTFTITPDKGYVIANVIVDGKSVGAVKSYTFEDVSRKHTIKATFAPADEQRNPHTGVDMNFEDVSETDWFYESVAYVFDEGLMNGTSATTFSPYLDTTRGMIVTILHRLAGSDAPEDVAPFLDVTSDQYYATAVAWAYENGIVSGYSAETFGPNDAITREQMAAILMNYAKFMGYDTTAAADLSKFSDADKISGYAVPSMAWANASGLINGKGDSILDPTGNAQRCEVAAILYRFCENIVK